MHSIWTPELETGIASIDADHREILELIAAVIHNRRGPDSLSEAKRILRHLEDHVLKHFADEEREMAATHYPEMLAHLAEHGRLAEYIASLGKELKEEGGDIDLLVVSSRLLCNWLVTHITCVDRAFADFLHRTGYTDAAVTHVRASANHHRAHH